MQRRPAPVTGQHGRCAMRGSGCPPTASEVVPRSRIITMCSGCVSLRLRERSSAQGRSSGWTRAFYTLRPCFVCRTALCTWPVCRVKKRKEVKTMNTLVIVLIAAVCLFGAYALYGRWLANKWASTPPPRPRLLSMRMAGTMFPPTVGRCSPTSSAPLPVQALSPVPSRLPLSAGCPFCCGSCWAASSSVPSPTSALCTLPSRMAARAWAC